MVNISRVSKCNNHTGPKFPSNHVTWELKNTEDVENVPPAPTHSSTKLGAVVDAIERPLKSVVAGGAEAPPCEPATASSKKCFPPLRPPSVSAMIPEGFLQRSPALSGRARLQQFCSKILNDCEVLTGTASMQPKVEVNSEVCGTYTLQQLAQRTRDMGVVPFPDSPTCTMLSPNSPNLISATKSEEPSAICDAQHRDSTMESPGFMPPMSANITRRRERRRCRQSRPAPSANSPAIKSSPDKVDEEEEEVTCTTTTASSDTTYCKAAEEYVKRNLDAYRREMAASCPLRQSPVHWAPLSDASLSPNFSPVIAECQDGHDNSIDDFSPGALNTAFMAAGSKESSSAGNSPQCSSSSAGDAPMLNWWWERGEEGTRHATGNWHPLGSPKLVGNQEVLVCHQLSTILEVDTSNELLATNTEAASSLPSSSKGKSGSSGVPPILEMSAVSVNHPFETAEVQLDALKYGLTSRPATSERLGRLPLQRQCAQPTLEETMLENVAQPSLLCDSIDSISVEPVTVISRAAGASWFDNLSPVATLPAATHRRSCNPLLLPWLKEQQQQLSPSTPPSSPLSESLLSFMAHEQSIWLAEQDG